MREAERHRGRGRRQGGGGEDRGQRQIAAFNRLPWGATEGDGEGESHIWSESDAR